MKRFILFAIILLQATTGSAQSALVIDHTSASLFENIPSAYITAAAKLRSMYRHASVGTTIDGGLNCLQGTRNRCTEYPQYQYDRRNWAFQLRPNSGWYGKINDFAAEVRKQVDSFDVFAFKYCYLDGLDMVAEPCGGSPIKADLVNKAWETLRDTLLRLEQAFPDKKFVWWTIPLTQVGQACTDALNARIRTYCEQEGKILFDLADIESHDTVGNHTLTSEGLEYAFKPYCGEQKPDAQACHPNDFGGMIIAKSFWVLMAHVAGWQPAQQSVSRLQQQFSISPHPAEHYIDIAWSTPVGFDTKELRLYNESGQLVRYPFAVLANPEGIRIYVSGLPAGLYTAFLGDQPFKFIKR